jgi:hypothetical protein
MHFTRTTERLLMDLTPTASKLNKHPQQWYGAAHAIKAMNMEKLNMTKSNWLKKPTYGAIPNRDTRATF